MPEHHSTHEKALALNLDPTKYGVIAEIGAGQEVAGWFFKVGAAAGTVAKTISAYDMKVSDEIYGKSSRYVARDRVDAMLDFEYDRLIDRLGPERGSDTTFFAFADTVSARNYQGTNVCHGWMGLRFQNTPGSAPSTIRLHVCMLDSTNQFQQQVLGVLGVNLIHAVYFHHATVDEFLGSLFDDLSLERIEVDHIDVEGPAFEGLPDDLCLHLVLDGLARVVAFSPETDTHDPMSAIYKRPVVIERGSFAAADPAHEVLMEASLRQLGREATGSKRVAVGLYELSVANPAAPEPLSEKEVQRRLGELRAVGRPVLLTNIPETFNFTTYLKRFTSEPIRFAVGLTNVVQLFHEAYYTALDGGVLEALSRLLSADVKFYVLPREVETLRSTLDGLEGGAELWTLPEEGTAMLENIEPATRLRHLYRYMCEAGAMVTVEEGQSG